MLSKLKSRDGAALGIAAVLATAGLGVVTVGALWVAGFLGIGTAAASQIVAAIAAGGWALRIVTIAFGGAIIGAIAATVWWYIDSRGRVAAAL